MVNRLYDLGQVGLQAIGIGRHSTMEIGARMREMLRNVTPVAMKAKREIATDHCEYIRT